MKLVTGVAIVICLGLFYLIIYLNMPREKSTDVPNLDWHRAVK